MKAKKEMKSGSVKIDVSVYRDVAKLCLKTGTKVSFYVTQAVREKLQKETVN